MELCIAKSIKYYFLEILNVIIRKFHNGKGGFKGAEGGEGSGRSKTEFHG